MVVRLLVVHTPSGGRAPFSGSRTPGDEVIGYGRHRHTGLNALSSNRAGVLLCSFVDHLPIFCASGSRTLGRWNTSTELPVVVMAFCGPCGVVVHLLVVHTPSGGRAPLSGSRTPGDEVIGLRSPSPYGT